MSPLPDSSALCGVDPRVRTIPLENISSLAGGNFGNPDIIPLWFGEGDVKTPAFIGEAMMRAVQAGEVFYTSQNGVPVLRNALATYLSGPGSPAGGAGPDHGDHQRHARDPDRAPAHPVARRQRRGDRSGVAELRQLRRG